MLWSDNLIHPKVDCRAIELAIRKKQAIVKKEKKKEKKPVEFVMKE